MSDDPPSQGDDSPAPENGPSDPSSPENGPSDPADPSDPDEGPPAVEDAGSADGASGGIGRRDLLKYGFGGAVAAGLAAGGYAVLSEDSPTGEWSAGDAVDRETVERFAPVLAFGSRERWYPTDPREYAEGGDGEAVVDGFEALDGYTAAFRERGAPPDPVVFYRTLVEDTSSLGVVQYWMYSAFDQFAVNFHWHDWELVQVFFDRDAEEAVLVSASAHSRKVPNNEHLGGPGDRVAILSEVGSHSSATDVDRNGRFVRLESGDLAADVTNALVRIARDRNPLPLAYGLPRGEGGVLPYVVPELDGRPLYEHPDLPNVREADLIDEPLAIRDLESMASPPTDVPAREPGLEFVPEASDLAGGDRVAYELAPIAPVAEAIGDFAGPQLSFEFPVPGVVEDQFANHLTSVGLPWEQERYDVPLADVTDEDHRERIADRFGLGAGGVDGETVVAQLQEASGDADGGLRGAPDAAREELAPEIGYTLSAPTVESVAVLGEDDSVAVPTVGGAVRLTGVEAGERRLVVDGAGYAPHAERLGIGEGEPGDVDATEDDEAGSADGEDDAADERGVADPATAPAGESGAASRPGADGYVTAVRRDEAAKLRAEAPDAGGGGIDRVRIAEDYAGAAFDGRPPRDPGGEDGFAVYVHRGGTYVVDVVDGEGVPGTERVDPPADGAAEGGDGAAVAIDAETGKASLAEFLAGYLRESATLTREYRRSDDGEDGGDEDSDGDATTTDAGQGSGNGGGTDDGGGDGNGGGTTDGGGGPDGAPGVPELFESAAGAADRAADFARDGRLDQADGQVETVRNRLDALRTRIEAQRGGPLSETLATVLRDRVEGSDRRALAALEADR